MWRASVHLAFSFPFWNSISPISNSAEQVQPTVMNQATEAAAADLALAARCRRTWKNSSHIGKPCEKCITVESCTGYLKQQSQKQLAKTLTYVGTDTLRSVLISFAPLVKQTPFNTSLHNQPFPRSTFSSWPCTIAWMLSQKWKSMKIRKQRQLQLPLFLRLTMRSGRRHLSTTSGAKQWSMLLQFSIPSLRRRTGQVKPGAVRPHGPVPVLRRRTDGDRLAVPLRLPPVLAASARRVQIYKSPAQQKRPTSLQHKSIRMFSRAFLIFRAIHPVLPTAPMLCPTSSGHFF